MRLLILLLLTLSLLSGCVSKQNYLLKEDEVSLLKKSLQTLEEQYDELGRQARELAEERDGLNEKLTRALAETSAARQETLEARAEIDRRKKVHQSRIQELEGQRAALEKRIKTLEAQLATLSESMEAQRRAHLALAEEKDALIGDLEDQLEKERIAQRARIAHMKSTFDELVGKLDEEIKRGEITISELEGKLTVNMLAQILFDSGRADVKPEGKAVLERVAKILKTVEGKDIRVEGHTDNRPISGRLQETFPSNWELSTARATNVVHFLQAQGLPGEKLSAAGFGPYRPLAGNDTEEERARNRRIQIVLVPPGQ